MEKSCTSTVAARVDQQIDAGLGAAEYLLADPLHPLLFFEGRRCMLSE